MKSLSRLLSVAALALLATVPAQAQTTYYMQGLLRQPDAATARTYLGIGGSGSGSVTNFAFDDFNPLFTVSVANPTTFPHVTLAPVSQAAHLFYASPIGGAGNPTFRAIDASDLPGGGGTVTSFSSGNLSPLFTTSVANPTTTPALSYTLSSQSANLVFAGPTSGGAAAPTFRSLVSGDIPDLSSKYLVSITNSSLGLLGTTLIASSNAPIAGLKSLSAGAGVSIQDNGGTNISISAPGNIAGVDIPMTFTSPYANNTNFNIDFTFAAQTLNTPTNLIVFNYATNWGLSATSRVANIFIQWTNFGRRVYFVNQATNWHITPQVWYIPPGYGARFRADMFGQLDTNLVLSTFIDSFPVGSNTTATFNPTNAFPSNSVLGVKLWLDASRGAFQDETMQTPCYDGSQIRGWTDLCNYARLLTNNNVLQLVSSYHTPQSGLFNVPTVQFNSGASWMQSPTFTTVSQPTWGFIVYSGRAAAIILDGPGGSRFGCSPAEAGPLSNVGLFCGTQLSTTGPNQQGWCLFSFFGNGASSIIRTNGVQAVTGNAGTGGVTSWVIGGDQGKSSCLGLANIAEILVINTNLTATQLTNVESYFYRKYPFWNPPTVQ